MRVQVIKRILSMRDVTNEEDWDTTVADHRERILTRFMSEIVGGTSAPNQLLTLPSTCSRHIDG